ncbi:MAG: glycosyltransferase family 39 protein [Actinobacteria bacterium]|nr:glycosyltransferase family 39 protein [Actinomycetota bacterium]
MTRASLPERLRCARKAECAFVLAFFLVLAVIFTWPLILHPHDGIIGGHGDPLLNSWIISWDARTFFTNPTGLFQGNILYPSRDVLAYSEHALGMGIIAAPVYLLSGNPVLAYNFLVFLGFVLAGLGCYLLVKKLTGSRWGGLVAGVFFSFCFYKVSRLSHLQIFFIPFLPFMLLHLYRYLERGRLRNLLLFALFFLVQSLCSWHSMLYCAIAAGLLWAWKAAFSRRAAEWKRLLAAAAALAAALAVMAPFALPYLRAHRRLPGFERSLKEVELYGARGEDFLRVLDVSAVYGEAPSPFREGSIGYENVLYPGVVILVLAAAALLLRRRDEEAVTADEAASFRRGELFFLLLAALALLMTFGPRIAGRWNPFYMVPYRLGAFKFTRVPARFTILVSLALAVLGGYGASKIARRAASGGNGGREARRLTGASLVVLLALELLTVNIFVHPVAVGAEVPEVYTWLRDQGDVRVIELPTGTLGPVNLYDRNVDWRPQQVYDYIYRECRVMYFSTYHWKKMVNGYSGYMPFFYRRIMMEMQGFPSARSVALLRGLGVDYVLWDWSWVESQRMEEYNIRLFSIPGLQYVDDFGSKTVFRVEPGETVFPADLEVEAAAPRAVPTGAGFDLGLLVSNRGEAPMVCVEEAYQDFSLVLEGGDGQVIEVPGKYRPPFFVDAGETISLPLQAGRAVPPGSYRAELRLVGGVLGERSFRFPLEVAEVPDWDRVELLNGTVEVSPSELALPGPDGLYPVATASVANTGGAMWRALDQNEDFSLQPGSAYLGLAWTALDGSLWEQQSCSLPCDLSPGQSVAVPLLARPPAAPGEYYLDVGVYVVGGDWIVPPVRLRVRVEGWMEAAADRAA